MAVKEKKEIEIAGGTNVLAQTPIIVSASRSTDIPAFYSDWFIERLEAGYVKWYNPFNNQPLYVSFANTKLFVFWSKNPKPMLERLDKLEALGFKQYYFQFSLNDYVAEGFEPNVPNVEERIDTFRRLSDRIGKERVIWRFDPLLLTDKISVEVLLERIAKIGRRLKGYTEKLVFSFIDIASYKKVKKNLVDSGCREFIAEEQLKFANGLARLNDELGLELATCGELADLSECGIKHNKCVDDELIMRLFHGDEELMNYIGAEKDIFGEWHIVKRAKDKGQRAACGCIVSKDIGEYNTCPHLCHYCYANANNAAALENWERHQTYPHSETITGK